MRVHLVDPSAYTPPYDHALCMALAAAGAHVELHTSRFSHGSLPPPAGYIRREDFYRAGSRLADPAIRRAVKLAEHVPDMLRYRRTCASAEVVHFQWLAVQQLDRLLLPGRHGPTGARRPLLLTAHDLLPREPLPGQLAGQRRLYDRFDAVIVHSEHGRRRLVGELSVDPSRVHVIPHGAFVHLAGDLDAPAPPAPMRTDKPVVLCFGLMRPYKGIDLLIDAWRGIDDAELWLVGMPRMDISALRSRAPAGVRFVPRFVADEELPAYFRRADLVVLPYREIDQSGVLATALAFARPLLLSDVGGFPELARTGAARTFPAGDAVALHDALVSLLADPAARAAMTDAARTAAGGVYSWEQIGRSTLALYRSLLEGSSR